MTRKFNIILSTTALAATLSLGAVATYANGVTQGSNAENGQYGLVDYKMQVVPNDQTSTGNPPAVNVTTGSDVNNTAGVAGKKVGAATAEQTASGQTSNGGESIPAQNQLKKDAGIVGNEVQAGVDDAVVSSDGAAVGTITKVMNMGKTDQVYVRTDDTLDTAVSMFKITVPASEVGSGKLTLNASLSDILTELEKQQDQKS
ncbi:hypothetical protein [Thioclava nitratireducens]|uniref:hypothetical protein n=1 Tax=Thioclava nitratireducens TaxID=1915078 RepID=UPI002480014C|nr:hypothetical protein [Thioclava nitratireducens]WGT50761.1 hypothetical protein P0N61_01660 [Thioclava nitratireducens]